MQTSVKLRDTNITLCCSWEGGEYIDIGTSYSRPVEVINVWDYEKSCAQIPFTRDAMRKAIFLWIAEYGREDLLHDIVENWQYL